MKLSSFEVWRCLCGGHNPRRQPKCLSCGLASPLYSATPLLHGGENESKESQLHTKIITYCQSRKWIAFHGSMAHRSFRTLGEPDLTILADKGHFYLVELKSAKGKLKPDQAAIAHQAGLLGHIVHIIRNYKSFVELVEGLHNPMTEFKSGDSEI